MKDSKNDKIHLALSSARIRRPNLPMRALAVLAVAVALARCPQTHAQFIGFGAGGTIGGTVGGIGVGFGGGAPLSLPIMINSQFPPILLVGMGDSVIYELIVSGPMTQVLSVQYATAPVVGTGYQWVTLTNFTLGASASAIVNVTIPFGQAWMVQVVAETGPPPGPTPDPARWAKIEPGTFIMGSPETEYDRSSDEGPQMQVTLSHGFWMERFEVTEGEYSAVVGSNPATFSGDANQPVEQVSWYDASNYCAMLTAQEHAAGRLPAGYEYRLPTEAEWEYVARAGTTNRFFFGDDHSYAELANYAWFDSDSSGSTHDVGGKQSNPWGIYDTSGNVFEWCSDWYGPYSGGALTDPTGPLTGANRVMRGGSWRFPGGDARSAARNFNVPEFASYGIGIRVVLSEGHD